MEVLQGAAERSDDRVFAVVFDAHDGNLRTLLVLFPRVVPASRRSATRCAVLITAPAETPARCLPAASVLSTPQTIRVSRHDRALEYAPVEYGGMTPSSMLRSPLHKVAGVRHRGEDFDAGLLARRWRATGARTVARSKAHRRITTARPPWLSVGRS
jgi:hypothetical protein